MAHGTGQVGQDAVKVGASTLGAGSAGLLTVGPAVAGLLTAAGVSASAPVVGWIVAGGLALAAGIIGLVGALRAGKARKDEAVAMASQMGLPDPEEVPGFVARALRNGPAWRGAELGKLKALHGLGKLFRKERKTAAKIAILSVLDLQERAAARGALPPSAPPTLLVQAYQSRSTPAIVQQAYDWTWPIMIGGLGVAIVASLILVLARRRR